MMKCVVIDDEPVAIDILLEYIAKVPFLELEETFRNALDALEYLRIHDVDLIFLDINMPDLSGIEFLNSLDYRPLVIFTTAYSEYAARSYDYEAVDYLVKPIEFDRFLKSAGRALSRSTNGRVDAVNGTRAETDKDGGSILIKSGTDYHRLEMDDILYVEGTGNYVTFVTAGRKIMSLMTLKDVLDKLPGDRFIRIHRSYIVAFHKIDVIQREQVIVRGERIPIGEVYRSELQKRVRSQSQ
jgi:two-component system LytT family response regulator